MKEDLQKQLVRDLLVESFEGLDRYDQAILELENGHASRELLNDIFRVIHTLKGTAGCLGFNRIQKVAHVGENLLDHLRSGGLAPSPEIAAALLRMSDALRELLQSIDATGRESTADHTALLTLLQDLRDGRPPSAAPSARPGPVEPPASIPSVAASGENEAWGVFDVPAAPAEPPPPAPAAETAAAWGLFDEPPAAAATPPPPPAEPVRAAVPPPKPAPRPTDAAEPAAAASTPPAAATSVRVDVTLLDKLMNLVGELVLARNQLVQVAQSRQFRPEAMTDVSQRLNLITTELQEGVMKTRMQPIGNVWGKFPRIVRDIAVNLGKQVRLDTFGSETELDRTIIEAIRDPLTHIVRNSIDHGIEPPEKRAAAGKPAEGHLIMRAYHEGGQVNIEIIDDGAGINLARVRQRALERNLISPEEAARASERELTNLIFLPGFSTAEKVTNVSGRGVGMDVVKTNIERIGGSVDLHSVEGHGTTLKIKIPLTLAIIPALIVRSSGQRFAIPQVSLLELVRLEGAAASAALESVYDAPVFRLRDRLLPLVFLHRQLRRPAPPPAAEPVLHIVVLQADQRRFGLVVDEILDTEEIVVKPLSKQLKGIPVYAGATIMGDGQVALILDVLGLAQASSVLGESRTQTTTAAPETETRGGERQQLLVISVGQRSSLAIPLGQAARLEEFPRKSIERAGSRAVVQYRGGILPLIPLFRYLPSTGGEGDTADDLQVVVFTEQDRSVGLVVTRIDDIVEDTIVLQPRSAERGILGSAIVQGRVTDLLDVRSIVHEAEPGFFAA